MARRAWRYPIGWFRISVGTGDASIQRWRDQAVVPWHPEIFVHLETRDAYGTETELPHLAKWLRGEPDDFAWFDRWLEMLRDHRAAGRTCRRARIVSEPLTDYQRWTLSFTEMYVDAGEETGYIPRARLTDVLLPGSGDFYVIDDSLVLFLHYAGRGTNAAYEISDNPRTVRICQEAFETVWQVAVPARDYRPE